MRLIPMLLLVPPLWPLTMATTDSWIQWMFVRQTHAQPNPTPLCELIIVMLMASSHIVLSMQFIHSMKRLDGDDDDYYYYYFVWIFAQRPTTAAATSFPLHSHSMECPFLKHINCHMSPVVERLNTGLAGSQRVCICFASWSQRIRA